MQYLDVQDSHNINSVILATCDSIDSGNNTNWSFNPSSCNIQTQPARSTTDSPVCTATTVGAIPINLYSALPKGGSSILLTFTDASDPYDHYTLEYGTKSGVYSFAASNIGGKGTRTYLVQNLDPSTTYYFRVRAGNGCATGEWSNQISAKTLPFYSTGNLITQSSLTPVDEEGDGTGAGGDGSLVCSYYTVRKGDSLSSIAKEKLGKIEDYKKIATLNQDTYPTLKTSSLLEVGWKLKIKCDSSKTKENQMEKESFDSAQDKTYDVDVKVTDEENNPVGGASVTLHSTPRQAKTNDKGIATFKEVEKGEHTVIIAYNGDTGEQKMVLAASDNVKRYELNVKIQRRNPLLEPVTLGVVGVLGLVIVVMGLRLRKLTARRDINTS